ncbi:DUF7483 domain-containing protein [Thalassospira lucentensis]|uniref:DUF7483 domain-containing protein n=1 Tax=Thalassospira lucentensis TaxID=168935 RepID=UPI003D29035C
MSILFDNPPLAIGCGDPGDPIDFACLFNGASNSELQLTPPATATNKFVIAAYIKRVKVGAPTFLCSAAISTTNRFWFYIDIAGQLRAFDQTAVGTLPFDFTSDAVFRDFATPYQIIMDYNEGDVSFIVDGITLTEFSVAVSAGAGHAPRWNQSIPHRISSTSSTSGGVNYSDGYLSDFKSFAGKSIAAGDLSLADFGRWNAQGNWVHKTFPRIGQGAVAYGASGFHHNFADPLDFGKDVSGNGNHFTSTGLTVDNQTDDTPTNNVSNFNPLVRSSGPARTLSDGNRKVQLTGSGSSAFLDQLALVGRKTVWRAKMTAYSTGPGTNAYIGLRAAEALGVSDLLTSGSLMCFHLGGTRLPDGTTGAGGATWGVGDVLDLVWDPDTANFEIYVNDALEWSVTYPNWIGVRVALGVAMFVSGGGSSNVQWVIEDGAGQDAYPQRSGSMICPEILNPDDYFTHRIKSGGASVSDLPLNPTVHKALVVSKRLDVDEPCVVTDTVNGAGFAWETSSAVSGVVARPQGLTAFNANGYLIGTDPAYQGNRLDLIWRASPKAGFDIVTVDHTTGTPTTVPQLSGGVIEYGWVVRNNAGQTRRMFHHLLGNDRYFPMDTAGGPVTDAGWFSSTANTVTLGDSVPTGIYTLYIWRSVPQFSSFGKYAPNDNNDGPFLPLDFSPRLFQPNGGGPNGARSIFVDDLVVNGGNDPRLALEVAAEAVTAYEYCDFVSNGVKARGVYTPINYSDTDFYYPAAWARTPGKFARAR